MRRFYEIGQLVEVPRAVLVKHDGVLGLPLEWVLQTAAEIEAAAAVPADGVDTEDAEDGAGAADADAGPDTLAIDGQTIKVIGQERKLLLHILEGACTIDDVSAVVWGSNEYETTAIKSAAKRLNHKLEAAGIGRRVVVTTREVFLR